MALLTAIDDCRPYDCPMLIARRKSFVGDATGAEKTNTAQRDAGTTACVALGIASGADIVRVHNVAMMANGLNDWCLSGSRIMQKVYLALGTI